MEIDVWNGEDSSSSESESDDEDTHGRGLRGRLDKKLHKLKLKSHMTDKHHTTKHHEASDGTGKPAVNLSPQTNRSSGRIEPRVLHGHTATKEVPFRKVCEAIRDHGFTKR